MVLVYTGLQYLGIKVCPDSPGRRAWMLVFLIACADAAMVLFALLAAGPQGLAIFCNDSARHGGGLVVRTSRPAHQRGAVAGLACSYDRLQRRRQMSAI